MNKSNDGMRGSLFTIAAASGSGKTSLVRALIGLVPKLKVSVSHVTRSARAGEENGVHYFFISESEFLRKTGEGEFLEQAEVFGYHYGTSRLWVEDTLNAGIDVILEIDWQGAAQIRTLFPKSVSIFILPPSIETLRHRLLDRQQDPLPVIEKRLAAATQEIAHFSEFDYLVVNDHFEQALADLQHIIVAKRLESGSQVLRHAKLLEDLLQNQ